MKKILISVTALIFTTASAFAGVNVGISGAFTMLDTSGTEVLKSSGKKSSTSKEEDVIVLKSKLWLSSIYQFISLLKRNKGAHCIASSGFVECYFASLFSDANIHTRQHHPTSMDIKNSNKYSLLRRAEYQNVLANTLEPGWIEHCRSNFSLRSILYFTFKDIIESRLAKLANNVFVLSAYAQLEQDLFYSIKWNGYLL